MKMHIVIGATVALLAAAFFCSAENPASGKKKILFYSESFGFRHSVVNRPLSGEMAHAERVFKDIAEKAGYEVHFSQSFHDLRDKKQLDNYDAIMFYTSGTPPINRNALLDWLKGGKALIGVHSATDSFRGDQGIEGGKDRIAGWPEYIEIIGGAFTTHGRQDPNGVTIEWVLVDEIYHHNRFSRDRIHVLMSVDTQKTNLEPQGMKPDGDYPLAWTNTYEKGRIFYTALGHREDVWTNPKFQQHLLGGIAWALGEKE